MTRNRKKRTQARRMRHSVSLFPFLAVLICTLGVLIVMLVMAAKSADVDARKNQEEDDSAQQALVDELESARDVHLAQIEGLEMVRPEVVDRLNDSRTNRSYLEDEIRKLKKEFKQVGDELVELDQQSKTDLPVVTDFPDEENAGVLEQLKQKVESEKLKLAKKREAANLKGSAKYLIMPHKGSGGTFRRPIFMECTKDAITLQPSEIRLAKSEFNPPLQPGNMLDSALLAIREYWQRYDLAGKEGSPYPLIVVRPNGAETFMLARMAMQSWDDEFGYELVEADVELEFGEKDAQLESEVNDAIKAARRRQRIQMARNVAMNNRFASSRYGGRDARPGLMASGPRGGFVSNSGEVEDSGKRGGQTKSRTFNSEDSRQSSDQDNSNQFSASTENAKGLTAASGSPANASADNDLNGEAGDLKIQNPYADQSLAKKRGKNWALPTQTAGATAYVRPIRIICRPNMLEIQSGGKSTRVQLSNDVSDAVGPMIDEVWKQIDGWGIPGTNAYWKPQLRFQIAQGGREKYLQLKGLLYESGLTVAESTE